MFPLIYAATSWTLVLTVLLYFFGLPWYACMPIKDYRFFYILFSTLTLFSLKVQRSIELIPLTAISGPSRLSSLFSSQTCVSFPTFQPTLIGLAYSQSVTFRTRGLFSIPHYQITFMICILPDCWLIQFVWTVFSVAMRCFMFVQFVDSVYGNLFNVHYWTWLVFKDTALF